MKSEFELLSVLFDALSTATQTFDAVKLQYPVQGFESIGDMRQAIRIAHARRYIQYPEENLGGSFHLDLT